MLKLVELLEKKLELAKEDSDFTFFFNLLVAGEAVTKIYALIAASNLSKSKDRHQYRILHGLVRASGIGEWSRAIDDLLVGTASQYILPEFRPYQAELTKKVKSSEWQHNAVEHLIEAMKVMELTVPTISAKTDLKSWFKLFTELRNKTRGHGAITGNEKTTNAAVLLDKSLRIIIENSTLLQIPAAIIKRNLSGKYRVSLLGVDSSDFDELRKNKDISLKDGVYLYLGGFKEIPLIKGNSDCSDFFIANGGFSNDKYEMLSYYTDNIIYGESKEFLAPTGELPPSESDGLGELVAKGNCFTNVPSVNYKYIRRNELEDDLFKLLNDERRTIVTLLGRGGIGKTSLALEVVPRLYENGYFEAIIWFSSRDIDLKDNGAKLVSASVISIKDISKYYAQLVLSKEQLASKDFNYVEYFQSQLTNSDIGPCLFIFDNFETTDNPVEIFNWVDCYIRNPNKVLITTRLREFVGDYPLNVYGMNKDESYELINVTAASLGVIDFVSDSLREQVFSVSGGHPYIIKIMLGELASKNMKGALPKIVAGKEDVLMALFERTYSSLSPCTQRIFLTLASWQSAVPRVVLEAIIMASFENSEDVEEAIDSLIQYSIAEEHYSDIDKNYFIVLPYAAYAFGQKKIKVSPIRNLINPDVKILQRFGVSKLESNFSSLNVHLSIFFDSLDDPIRDFVKFKDILECIAYRYNYTLVMMAEWLEESKNDSLLLEAKRYLLLFLELEANASEEDKTNVWHSLARLAHKLNSPFDEIHAYAEASQFSCLEFSELSNMVNKVNHLFKKPDFDYGNQEVKKELLSKLYSKAYERKSEANATDCSRIAWLALHLDEKSDASILVEQGMKMDKYNVYLLKLKDKLTAYRS